MNCCVTVNFSFLVRYNQHTYWLYLRCKANFVYLTCFNTSTHLRCQSSVNLYSKWWTLHLFCQESDWTHQFNQTLLLNCFLLDRSKGLVKSPHSISISVVVNLLISTAFMQPGKRFPPFTSRLSIQSSMSSQHTVLYGTKLHITEKKTKKNYRL